VSWIFNLLGAIWDVASVTSKYILLILFILGSIYYFKTKKKKFDLELFLQYSIKKVLLIIGPLLVLGVILSGILNYFIQNIWISLILLVISLGFSYKLYFKAIKKPKKLKLSSKIFFYIFSILFITCLLISLVLNNALWDSIMALFLFGLLFWEL